MNIIKFLTKRFFHSIFVIIGFSILIFLFTRNIPGDPARLALGENAPEWVVENLREEMHLNDPVYIQYYFWVKDLFKGKMGTSLNTWRDVSVDIKEYFPASLELSFYSGLFMLILAVIFGIMSGWYNNTWIDNTFRIIAYFGVITPSFIVAIFLILIFSQLFQIFPAIGRVSEGLHIPPTITGLITFDALITGNFLAFFDALKHLVLPVISLMVGPMAHIGRVVRSAVVDNLDKEFIVASRSYGIPEISIMFKYLFKPSFVPGLSMAGLHFAGLMANAFLVELIFNWPGLSRYGMTSMLNKDIHGIIGTTVIYALLFIIINIIVDIIAIFLDPRIELKK